jgi:hypothetical protein
MDFAAGVYLSEAQNPIPPLSYTLYMCIIQCIPYSILIHTGKGGWGELNQRKG